MSVQLAQRSTAISQLRITVEQASVVRAEQEFSRLKGPFKAAAESHRYQEVKMSGWKFTSNTRAANQAAKEAKDEVKRLRGQVDKNTKNIADQAKSNAKFGSSQWLDDLLNRIPFYKEIKNWFGTTGKQVTNFFKNSVSFIDKTLDNVPGWKFLKDFGVKIGRLGGKAVDLLGKFLSHPLVSKFLNILGLAANVFSIGSSIAQWAGLFDLQKQFNRFSDLILKTQNQDFQRLMNLIVPARNQAKKAQEIAEKAISRNFTNERVLDEIKKQNLNLGNQIKSQKAQIDGVAKGVAQAATAATVSAAIGKVVSAYQLSKVPSLANDLNSLKGRVGQVPPQFDNRLKGIESQVQNLKNQPGAKGPKGDKGDRGPQGIPGLNGKDGLNGRNGVDGRPGRDGINGKNGFNGSNGAPGRDGARGPAGVPGLTTVIKQEVPITVEKTIVVEKVDPRLLSEVQQAKTAAQTAAATSVATNNSVNAMSGALNSVVNTTNRSLEYAYKIGNHLGLSRVFAVLNLWCNLTILASTTSNIFSLLGSGMDSALSLFGFSIKGPDGEEIGASAIVKNTAEGMIKGVVGAENFEQGKIQLANLSRINTALTSVYSNIQSMVDPVRYGVGEIYERVSKSRNEDVLDGNKSERALWDESAEMMMNKNPLGRLNDATQNVSNNVSMITSTIDSAVSIGQSYNQLQQDRQQLKQAAADLAAGKNADKQAELEASKVPTTLDNFTLGKKSS